MKKMWFLALIFSVAIAGSAQAAEVKPVLKQAKIEAMFSKDGVDVVEQVTISNVQAIKGGKVEHIATQLKNAEVKNLEIKSGDKQLTVESKKGEMINKLFVPVPQGTSGDFTYNISYRLSQNTDSNRIPLVVPAVATDGKGNVVSIKLNLPKGKYLHDSFPIIDNGDSGTVEEYMVNVPNFLSIELGGSPAGIFTPANMYTIFSLLVILAVITAWLVSERKALKGGTVNV